METFAVILELTGFTELNYHPLACTLAWAPSYRPQNDGPLSCETFLVYLDNN